MDDVIQDMRKTARQHAVEALAERLKTKDLELVDRIHLAAENLAAGVGTTATKVITGIVLVAEQKGLYGEQIQVLLQALQQACNNSISIMAEDRLTRLGKELLDRPVLDMYREPPRPRQAWQKDYHDVRRGNRHVRK